MPTQPASSESPLNPSAAPTLSRRERLRRLSPASKYALLGLLLAVIAIGAEFAVHAIHSAPRDSRAIAERELSVNVLAPGERVMSTISVVRRTPIDYFRATRGILALTDKRLIFLGLRPRDFLSAADAPPTFDERDFPLDTLIGVDGGRALAGLTKGVIVRTPNESLRLGVPSDAWPAAEKLVATMSERRSGAHVASVTQESMRKVADAEWARAVAAWRKPQYYTVRRGDALGSVATQWNTTTEALQRLNKLPDNRIRVGQTLLVRQAM